MWNVVICDDEPEICGQITEYLHQIEKEQGEPFSISVFSSGEELLHAYPQETDLLLLDIRMNQLSGMDTARQLRATGKSVMIIFITTMTQYAIEGYSVHAYGFLKKPLSYPQVKWQITDALQTLRKNRGESLILNTNFKTDVINTNDIVYIEAYGHDINLFLSDRRCLTHAVPLNTLERQLSHQGFFRCHKSYLVNFRHIRSISQSELSVTADAVIPLSRHRRKEFLTAFSAYQGGTI